MNIQDLIPKHKGDTETAAKLKNYSYDQIKPIIPNLLTWMQDMNWPVAGPVADYLETLTDNIGSELVKILQGDDEVWKYWIIGRFGRLTKDENVLTEIKRIASKPTKAEIVDFVDERAREILEDRTE
jgi:hypothetical protein